MFHLRFQHFETVIRQIFEAKATRTYPCWRVPWKSPRPPALHNGTAHRVPWTKCSDRAQNPIEQLILSVSISQSQNLRNEQLRWNWRPANRRTRASGEITNEIRNGHREINHFLNRVEKSQCPSRDKPFTQAQNYGTFESVYPIACVDEFEHISVRESDNESTRQNWDD